VRRSQADFDQSLHIDDSLVQHLLPG
jgi:hypothetical protein